MNKISDYKRKKYAFKGIDNVRPGGRGEARVSEPGCNIPRYSFTLITDGCSPEPEWLYAAISICWPEIQEKMKKIAVKDVNKTKGEAAKEAGDFLGLVGNE